MRFVTKFFFAVLAVLGIALGTAATASADESGFIEAIEALDHYSTVYPDETVQVGYRVCRAFDLGGDQAAVATVRKAYNGDDSEFADYHATLFAQAAAYNLCPQHGDEIGQI